MCVATARSVAEDTMSRDHVSINVNKYRPTADMFGRPCV